MAALLADGLTFFRLSLTFYLVWVGFNGVDRHSTLALIVYALLIGWTADILDGWFARRSNSPTRLGHLDFALDMVMVAGSLLAVTALGFIPAKVTVIYLAISIALVCKFPSKSMTMAVACPAVFAPFYLSAIFCPNAFRLSLLWALSVLILDWKRFEGIVLEFVDTFPGGVLKPIGERWRKWRGLPQIDNIYDRAKG